jgi:hypothetical protein
VRSAGIKPSKPDWPLSSTGLSSLSGCAQVVSPQVLAPSYRGVAFRLSVMLGHDLEPKIFWGHEKSARGGAEPSLAPSHLDPDGWLVRIPAPKELRLRARKLSEELVVHLRAVPRKPTLPVGRGVGR